MGANDTLDMYPTYMTATKADLKADMAASGGVLAAEYASAAALAPLAGSSVRYGRPTFDFAAAPSLFVAIRNLTPPAPSLRSVPQPVMPPRPARSNARLLPNAHLSSPSSVMLRWPLRLLLLRPRNTVKCLHLHLPSSNVHAQSMPRLPRFQR